MQRAKSPAVSSSAKAARANTPCSARVKSIDRFVRSFPTVSVTTFRSLRPCCRSIPNSMPTYSASAPPAPRSHCPTFRSIKRLPRARRPRRRYGELHLQSDAGRIQNRRNGNRRRRHRRRGDDGRRRRPRNRPRKISSAPSSSRTTKSRRSSKPSISSPRKCGKKKREFLAANQSTATSTSGFASRSPKTSPRRCASSKKASAKIAFSELNRRRSDRALRQERRRTSARCSRIRPRAKEFHKIIKSMEEDELRTMVVDEKIRPDGRKPDEIRPIWSKVHYVPRVHGSGVFTRGQTQVFTAATLGSKQRRAASRRHRRARRQALHALLQLPAVLGRRDAPDARTRPSRNRPRRT